MSRVNDSEYMVADNVGTPMYTANGSEIAAIDASAKISELDGGEGDELFAASATGFGAMEEDLNRAMRARKASADNAVDAREAKKPKMRTPIILIKSAEGSRGASGSITRLGTKKTASHLVKNATAGVNAACVTPSTMRERRKKRSVDIVHSKSSMDANGAGNEMPSVAKQDAIDSCTRNTNPNENKTRIPPTRGGERVAGARGAAMQGTCALRFGAGILGCNRRAPHFETYEFWKRDACTPAGMKASIVRKELMVALGTVRKLP